MKTALIIAGAVGAYVLVRRKQLGHMPHSLKELLPFLPGACCSACASSGAGAGSDAAVTGPSAAVTGGDSPPFVPEVFDRATTIGDAGPFSATTLVYGSSQGACA